jgi:calcineurin-like phosphoesterase family protein
VHDPNNIKTDKLLIHGHRHLHKPIRVFDKRVLYDVGVDANKFAPVSLSTIKAEVKDVI